MNLQFCLKQFQVNDLGFVAAFFSDRLRTQNLRKTAQNLPKNSAFIFREYDLDKQKKQELAAEISEICKKSGVKFFVAKDLELATKLGAEGFHLSDLDKNYEKTIAKIATENFIISLSCHSLQTAKHAQNMNIDLIFLSPIFATKSHEGSATLGPNALKEICKISKKPVFALGGISEKNIQDVERCGAAGFGGIEIFL